MSTGAGARALPTSAPRWRYRNLTTGLFAVLLLPPLLRASFPKASMIGPGVFAVLVMRAMLTARPRGILRVVMITAMVAVALRGARVGGGLSLPSWELTLLLHLLTIVGFAFVLAEVFRHVLASGPVDADKLYAAVSAYLLIGLTFASVFEALIHWRPGAFSFSNGQGGDPDAMMYFSLVTLCTVGYGDILPALPEARVLAVLEAILGQLYLAVLMARLVGLNLSDSAATTDPLVSSSNDQRDPSFHSSREAP